MGLGPSSELLLGTRYSGHARSRSCCTSPRCICSDEPWCTLQSVRNLYQPKRPVVPVPEFFRGTTAGRYAGLVVHARPLVLVVLCTVNLIVTAASCLSPACWICSRASPTRPGHISPSLHDALRSAPASSLHPPRTGPPLAWGRLSPPIAGPCRLVLYLSHVFITTSSPPFRLHFRPLTRQATPTLPPPPAAFSCSTALSETHI